MTVRRVYCLLILLVTCYGTSAWAEESLVQYNAAQPHGGIAAALLAVMQHNPSVQGKQAEVEAQRYQVNTAKAARYPTMSVAADNVNDEFGDQGTVRLQQPLWAFGKIDAEIEEARASYTVEQWDLLQVQRRLVEDTSVAYARIDGVRQRLVLAQKNIQEQERLYEQIDRRQQGQLASEADVILAHSRLLQAKTLRQRTLGDMDVAQAELVALTQIPVNTDEPIDPVLGMLSGDLEALALHNSAEVAVKEKRVEVARVGIRRQRVDSLPTLYARAEYDFLDQNFNTDPSRFGIALVADLDGMGFATRNKIKGASARFDAAQQDLQATIEDIRRRVSVLNANRDTLTTLIDSQREVVLAVEATLESFIRQYDSGRKSWVEVLNTQRELTALRFELSQMGNDWLALSLRLAAITGRLDVLAGIDPV